MKKKYEAAAVTVRCYDHTHIELHSNVLITYSCTRIRTQVAHTYLNGYQHSVITPFRLFRFHFSGDHMLLTNYASPLSFHSLFEHSHHLSLARYSFHTLADTRLDTYIRYYHRNGIKMCHSVAQNGEHETAISMYHLRCETESMKRSSKRRVAGCWHARLSSRFLLTATRALRSLLMLLLMTLPSVA